MEQKWKRQSSMCCRDSGTKEWKIEKAKGEGSCRLFRKHFTMTTQWAGRHSGLWQPHQPHPTVPWPPSSGTPINKFNTEGYISCAFPTLFPAGAADFVAPRPNAVTIFKHLLMYDDSRFARHPYTITEMHWPFRQSEFTFVSILLTLDCLWKSCVIWLDVPKWNWIKWCWKNTMKKERSWFK